jgi:hypothetical protein
MNMITEINSPVNRYSIKEAMFATQGLNIYKHVNNNKNRLYRYPGVDKYRALGRHDAWKFLPDAWIFKFSSKKYFF